MENQKCVKWTNRFEHYHKTFADLFDRQILCDVTLTSEGQIFKAHQFLLSSCSSYFQNIFEGLQVNQHPVIFLRDVTPQEIKCLLDYMYKGETTIPQNIMSHFLKTCASLDIQGLCSEENSTQNSEGAGSKEIIANSGCTNSQTVVTVKDATELKVHNFITKKRKNTNNSKGRIKTKRAKCASNTESTSKKLIKDSSIILNNSSDTSDSEEHQNLTEINLPDNPSVSDDVISRDVLGSPPYAPQSISPELSDVDKEVQVPDSITSLSEKSDNPMETSDEKQSNMSSLETDMHESSNSESSNLVLIRTPSEGSTDSPTSDDSLGFAKQWFKDNVFDVI